MSESIHDILKKRGLKSQEPQEFMIIRKYVQDRYSITPKLSISGNIIRLTVPSGPLANHLRYDLPNLKQLVNEINSTVKIIIKIG